jgi:hypothetical protein
MNKLLKMDSEAVKAIIGWCSFGEGSRITTVKPEGYESHGDGDAWNEEMWCHDRVEAAILAYKKFYLTAGYSNIAAMQLRKWVKAIFWESKELSAFREYEHLVVAEIVRFKKLVAEDVKANPRPRFYEVA